MNDALSEKQPESCGKCRFWRKSNDKSFLARNYGTCHRLALAPRFPLADRTEWCGEFQRTKERDE